MNKDVVSPVSRHLLHLCVHFKYLRETNNQVQRNHVIFIITLLPMSLILVLKLAISLTLSAISPVARLWTTWLTIYEP